MEIRGVGIVRVDKRAAAPVVLAVQLDGRGRRTHAGIPRLCPAGGLQADVKVPLIMLNAYEASTPAKIAAAAAGLVRGAFVAGASSPPDAPFL